MMSEDVKQIVAAYVLGCLDKTNLSQFIEYVHHGGKGTEGELGELQNIISLIPTLLNLETPPEYIKEKIAQQILERELITREVSHKQGLNKPSSAEERPLNEGITKLEPKPLHEKIPESKIQPEKQSTKSKSFSVFIIILFFIALAAFAGYLYKSNLEANAKIKSLNERLEKLKQEMETANNFLSENTALIEFFNSNDVNIFNLENVDTSLTAQGKLFISFSKGEGILSINISGKIFSDESLSIWAVMKRNNLLLGEIVYDPLIKYYKIEKIPAVDKNNIKIISVTIQKRRSGESTESRTLLISK